MGGIYPSHATVHVPALTDGVAAAAVSLGAITSPGVAATGIARAGQGLAVRIADDVVYAPRVVVPAGAGAAALAPPEPPTGPCVRCADN